jgi:hypothetical protein
MGTNPDFGGLSPDVATHHTLEVATGIVMHWAHGRRMTATAGA